MLTIIPSIASANPLYLKNDIDRLDGIGKLHLDVEDGNFVPNITFGMKTIQRIADYTSGKKELDAHLLVRNPEPWIDPLADCGIKRIAFHLETVPYPFEMLHHIHSRGMKAGFALNFITPAEAILPFITRLDYVIVMTAEPDGQCMLFNPCMLEKIQKISQYLGGGKEVWADGGISADTIGQAAGAGASTIIMGRAIFSSPDPEAVLRELLQKA
jgi:ribulose-phosphate 3-epimerase